MPPYPDGFVLSTATDFLSVRTPVHGVNLVIVAREIGREFTCSNVPYLQRGVLGGADKQS